MVALLERADAQQALRIGAQSRATRKIVLMVAALRRLIALEVDSDSIIDMLPPPGWPDALELQYWGYIVDHFTPPEIASVANYARRHGRPDHAERLFRHALTLTPTDLAIRSAFVSLLDQNFRRDEAEQMAAEGARLAPASVEANLMLARIQFSRGRFKNEAETLEALLVHEKENPHVWLEYAQLGRYSYDLPLGTENSAFVRAADCAGGNFGVIEIVAQYFLEQLSFVRAAEYYGRLIAQDPHAKENPTTCRDYARSLKGCGRLDEARDMIAIGLDRCRAAAAASIGENLEIARREEARLLHEAGCLDDELAVLRSIRKLGNPACPHYARPEYLPATAERLRRLRDIVASRDVVVFLQGPSFADFGIRLDEVADVNFVAATQGNFPPVEHELRRYLGRGADLLMVTNPQMVRSWHAELQEFLRRPTPNVLLTTHYALSNLQEQGTDAGLFLAEHDERLLFGYPGGGPPLPSRPLHFETSNSLSFFLPLITIGRPKRIFLVGADGGRHPNFKRPYFFYDDIDAETLSQDFLSRPDLYSYKNRPDRLQEANRRLLVDAIECDRIVMSSFRFLENLFDVSTPPIFNVCPHSAHRAFPRIDVATAIAMLHDHPE